MNELKKCPFCGGEAKLCCTDEQNHINYYWIYCKECGCKHPSSIHREAVIKAWNTRKPMEEAQKRLEEVKVSIFDDYIEEYEDMVCLEDAIEIIKEELM